MTLPEQVPNLEVYRGDPYYLQVPFLDTDNGPLDVTGDEFTASLGDPAVDWTVDLTHAADGYIVLSLTPDDTTNLAKVSTAWDLAWSRVGDTILRGRVQATVRAKPGVEIG